ncbi:MAG: hypothetical protein RL441_29 [Actinomycetota bacterium]|jgi:uncharacterized protein YxjI
MTTRFFVQQKITVLTNRYEVCEPLASGENGPVMAFAEQAKMKIREKITFFRDSTKAETLFSLRAEKVLDIHGKYFVEDASGALVGGFRKDFKKSLLQSSWVLFDSNSSDLFRVEEESTALAILRRFGDQIPFVGDLIKFFPYHFSIIDVKTGEIVGRYAKVAVIRDRYSMSVNDEAWASVDSRLMMAMAVALDALQSR